MQQEGTGQFKNELYSEILESFEKVPNFVLEKLVEAEKLGLSNEQLLKVFEKEVIDYVLQIQSFLEDSIRKRQPMDEASKKLFETFNINLIEFLLQKPFTHEQVKIVTGTEFLKLPKRIGDIMLYSTEGDIVHIEIESEYNTHKDKGMHDRMYDYQSYIVQNTFAEVEQNRKEHVKSKLGKFKSVVFYLFGSPQGGNEFYKRHPIEIDAGDYSVRSYFEAFYLRNMDVEKAIDNGDIFLLPFVYRRKGVIEIFEKKEGKLRELFDNTTVQQRLGNF